MDNICDSQRMHHEEDVIEELGKLPKTLKESYDVVHQRIKDSGPTSHAISEKALKWLLCAQRPLSKDEFIAAISVDSEGHCTPLSTTQLLGMCCNMVVLDAELDVFRFAHLSVQEYLEDRGDYTIIETHKLAAERCIDVYITQLGSRQISKLTVKQNNIFNLYSTVYWPIHYQHVESRHLVRGLKEKVMRFLFRNGDVATAFGTWTSAVARSSTSLPWGDPAKEWLRAAYSSPPTPLFLACFLGLLSVIDDLSSLKSINWNQRNLNGDTGLHLAAANGHVEVVQQLLGKGAELEAKTNFGWTALHRAASAGHEKVVKLLLEKGADIEAKTNYGWTALHCAASAGHEKVVKLLSDHPHPPHPPPGNSSSFYTC
jgi:hypothetical protein